MRATNHLKSILAAAVAATALPASAQVLLGPDVFENGVNGVSFSNGGIVPDGNPGGWADTRLIHTPENKSVLEIAVSILLTSGYNGDIYGYLRSPGGQIAVLFNRVGATAANSFGYSDTGMNITLRDNAPTDIHLYQTVSFNLDTSGRLTGVWQPDGRTATTLVTDASPRTATLNSLKGAQPDGNWTLFLADLSGGEQTLVQSWGVQLTVVPEPSKITLATATFLAAFAAFRRVKSKRPHLPINGRSDVLR